MARRRGELPLKPQGLRRAEAAAAGAEEEGAAPPSRGAQAARAARAAREAEEAEAAEEELSDTLVTAALPYR